MNNTMSKTFGDLKAGDKVYYLKDEFGYNFNINEGVVSSNEKIKGVSRVRIKIKIDGMKDMYIFPFANDCIEVKHFSHFYTKSGTYIVSDKDKFKELMNSIVEYKEAIIETQTKNIEKLNKFSKEINKLS